MAEQILVSDVEDDVSDLESLDREIFGNMRLAAPHMLEKKWRLYGGVGKIPDTVEKKDAGKFNPHYVPCIFPVKKKQSEPWDKRNGKKLVNVSRCGHRLPSTYEDGGKTCKLEGKELQAYAEIHCREHIDWLLETHGKVDKETGRLRPPQDTRIKAPRWVERVGEDPDMTDGEKRVKKMESRMEGKKSTRRDTQDAVNKSYGITTKTKAKEEG